MGEESMRSPEVKWNDAVKLILSDVDETVADLYVSAVPEMIIELSALLEEGMALFFVTGAGLQRVQSRIVDHLPPQLRRHMLISACNGAEVWGYSPEGTRRESPYYSVYDAALTEQQKTRWREIMQEVVAEFKLQPYPATPLPEFKQKAGNDPLAVMYEDRGPQITLEVVNGYDLTPQQVANIEKEVAETNGVYDLRIPILEYAERRLKEAGIPITPRLGGIFALDFAIQGVNKTTSVKHVLENVDVLRSLGLTRDDLKHPNTMEIWGDKFSAIRGGTDRHMSEALPRGVRSIDFREEDVTEFLPGYNTVVWDGSRHLHDGLLEYLQSRHKPV